MKKYIFYVLILYTLISCGISSTYIGKSYAPTTSVDVFLDPYDVPHEYEIMGRIEAEESLFGSIEQTQQKVEEIARKKGADALILEGVIEKTSNPQTKTTVDTTKDVNGNESQTITTSQSINKWKSIRATFIKYRQ